MCLGSLMNAYIYRVYQKKLGQNKMSINLCFIGDILFMNSFHELTHLELQKKNYTRKLQTSCSNYHLTLKWININFIATMIRFNKTLKSLHFSGKSNFLIKFNINRTNFSQTRSCSVFLLLSQRLLNVVKIA